VELMEGVMANKRKMQELEANLLHKLTSTQVCLFVCLSVCLSVCLGCSVHSFICLNALVRILYINNLVFP